MAKKGKIYWPSVFIEFFGVLLGVSLAFMLNNWQQKMQERKLEKALLKGIYTDLCSDISTIDTILKTDSIQYYFYKNIEKKLISKKINTKDALQLISNMMSVNISNFNMTGYNNMVHGGNLNLIQSIRLRNEILKYYTNLSEVQYIKNLQDDFLNRYLTPICIEHINFIKQTFMPASFIKNQSFINTTMAFYVLSVQHMEQHQKIRTNAMRLSEDLANYLKISE